MTDTVNIPEIQDKAHDAIERIFPGNKESSELTIECNRMDYSASAIAHAVEDCDAHLLNLNVTSLPGKRSDSIVVDLRVNHRNSEAVARSLERYGFAVTSTSFSPDDQSVSKARANALELLHYLES